MTTDNYVAKANEISKIMIHYVVDQKDDWKLVKEVDGIQVFNRTSPDTKGNMYKVETILNAPPSKVLAAVDPTKSYRIQWDEFLAELKVEAKLTENIYLIYHGTRTMLGGLVSARDSLDVVTIGQNDNYYFVAAGTVDHPNYPPRENSVRICQYSCGYVIYPVEGALDKSKFIMIMNTDMKMNNIANFFSEPVKPRLLMEKIKNLRRGLETLKIEYS